MIADERRQEIAQIIEETGSATVEMLAQRYGVSPMTVWRDLKTLDTQGRIQRIHGGAVRLEKGAATEPRFYAKRQVERSRKEALGRYAAERFVSDGDILALEGGTTVAGLIPHLNHNDLTILSNGLDVLSELSLAGRNHTLMSCGGILRERSRTFVGPVAEAFFESFRVQKAFLSATGLDAREGLFDPNPLEIQVKRAMAMCAEQRIILLDSSKFGVRSLSPFLFVKEMDILVTDADAPKDTVEELRRGGVTVHNEISLSAHPLQNQEQE